MTRATAAAERGRHVYSVILPTYNERENIPLIVCLISRGFEDACVHLVSVGCHPVPRVSCVLPIRDHAEGRAGGRPARHSIRRCGILTPLITFRCALLHQLPNLVRTCKQSARTQRREGLGNHRRRR